MDLAFLAQDARSLGDVSVEACACWMYSDRRPVHGLAGLLDWQLGGRLSALMKQGFATGAPGEALLWPGRPHVPFEKVLVLGLGARDAFDGSAQHAAMTRLLQTLEGLRVRRCLLELPGRLGDAVGPEAAIDATLDLAGASEAHDAWWVVDTPEAHKAMTERLAQRRRRLP